MNFGNSILSDSSDDSPLYEKKNIIIKLKDLRSDNNNYNLSNNFNNNNKQNEEIINENIYNNKNELEIALEKEKFKSILSKGNSKNRRKPPPPPVSNKITQQEKEKEREIEENYFNERSKNTIQINNLSIQRHSFENVDYSPLTTPENFKQNR